MDKKYLRKLLRIYFSEFRRSMYTTLGIFTLLSVAFIIFGSMDLVQALISLPIVMFLFGTIIFGRQFSLYLKGLKDIRKSRWETKYIIAYCVEEEKRSLFTKGGGVLNFFTLVSDQEECFHLCTCLKNINPTGLNDYMTGRRWHITYLEKSRIILRIQLDNTPKKDPKRTKLEIEIAKAAKNLFGPFGKK